MRKFFGIAMMVAMVALLSACGGSGSSPSAVVEKAMKCIQDKDYEGYTDYLYIEVKEGEDLETQKKGVAAMLGSKMDKTLARVGGVKGFEILSEEITPAEGDKPETAVVNVKVEYGNGDVKEDKVKLKKDSSGNWKIDMGK